MTQNVRSGVGTLDDIREKLNAMAAALEKARALRSRAEGQKEQLEQERLRILQEMQALGVTPETLDEEIARLEATIRQELEEAQRLIPWDLLRSGAA